MNATGSRKHANRCDPAKARSRRRPVTLVACTTLFAGCAAIGRCRSGQLVGPSDSTARRSPTKPAAPIRLPWPSGSGRSARYEPSRRHRFKPDGDWGPVWLSTRPRPAGPRRLGHPERLGDSLPLLKELALTTPSILIFWGILLVFCQDWRRVEPGSASNLPRRFEPSPG